MYDLLFYTKALSDGIEVCYRDTILQSCPWLPVILAALGSAFQTRIFYYREAAEQLFISVNLMIIHVRWRIEALEC